MPKRNNDLPPDIKKIAIQAGRRKNGVPKGLTHCRVCGDWKGRCFWNNPLDWHKGPTPITCRCDANLCHKCGEPIYEYRLGSNIYDEASQQVLHVAGMVGMMHACGKPRIALPYQIEADWDKKYAPVLAGFPVELVYVGVRPRKDRSRKPIIVRARYVFHPGSFLEASKSKRMHYRSRLASDFYVEVIFYKVPERWETLKFRGAELIAVASAASFEEAMTNSVAIALHPDEPAS